MTIKTDKYLTDYTTRIPVIQRDYVQGADRWKGKRNPFIDALLDSLENNTDCLLDFVYGVDKTDGFIPLDGQQRLTSLNLLGWMLRQRSGISLPGDVRVELNYDTRDSSREFCAHLFDEYLPAGRQPSEYLKKCIWYAEEWDFDPTIKAMLDMLDVIDAKLDGRNINKMAERFFTSSPIGFEMLDIKVENGEDDLYIKINARGKWLTDFEHWKASFIKFLEDNHPKLRGIFEDKIEHEWCDLFWHYALPKVDDNLILDNVEEESYPRIDEFFMRFFWFITNMLWAGNNDLTRVERETGKAIQDIYELGEMERNEVWRDVYRNEDNVNRLFSILDAASKLGDVGEIAGFFEKYLYSNEDPLVLNLDEDRVNIFGESEPNIFAELITKKIRPARRPLALLWGILSYRAKYPSASTCEIQSFIRVFWSYLQSFRQRLAKSLSVETDFRVESISKMQETLNMLLKNQDIFTSVVSNGEFWTESARFHGTSKYSKDVIPLLNHPWLRCDLTNLQESISSLPAGQTVCQFKDFVSLSQKERIIGLINLGWKGTPTTTKVQSFFTYGIEGGWDYILTGALPELELWIKQISSPETIWWMGKFVSEYIDDLLDVPCEQFGSFYWNGGEDYRNLFAIARKSAITLIGYKLDPIAYVVAKRAGVHFTNPKDYIGEINGKHVALYNANSTHWGISIPIFADGTGLKLDCVKDGWSVSVYPEGRQAPLTIPAALLSDGNYQSFTIINGTVQLLPNRNYIETGVELLNTITALIEQELN